MSTTTETAVRERGINFGAEMVRAILDGRKTQTRRIVKPQPDSRPGTNCTRLRMYNRNGKLAGDIATTGPAEIFCPYGVAGERLWVREGWRRPNVNVGATLKPGQRVVYRAGFAFHDGFGEGWRSPVHMPRWASRITLEIESVRVEPLCNISFSDALAEGVRPVVDESPLDAYRVLWNEIHGAGAWEQQRASWVWCVAFRRV